MYRICFLQRRTRAAHRVTLCKHSDARARGVRRAGLALALIYAAGFVGERVVLVWGKAINIPGHAGSLIAGLVLRNVPGPWRPLLAATPGDWLAAVLSNI